MPRHHKTIAAIVTTVCLVFGLFGVSAQDQKLKAEEIVARHLAAIGSAEARAAAKTRIVGGEVTAVNRIGSPQQMNGDGTIISTGPKLRFGMKFTAATYAGEQMAFDGKRASTAALAFGARSTLSIFLMRDDLPLKEGLLGGVLSTTWPLLRIEQQQPRLQYKGLKKIADRGLHTLGYSPRKGAAGLEVTLYFDPETFHHVMTQYRSELTTTRHHFTEEFGDFQVVDGLTLPHRYKLALDGQVGDQTVLIDWAFNVIGISHKETFGDQVFTIK